MDDKISQKLFNYQADESAKQLVKATPILLLVGPSGAGKDSIIGKLSQAGGFHRIISHTTRKPRINKGVMEQDGKDYFFIDKPKAEAMLDDKAFIEAKLYSHNVYGTSVAEIQRAHDEAAIAMTDLEVQGVAEYKELDPNVLAVFLLPPNFEIWQDRLQKRHSKISDKEDYCRRLRTALKEFKVLLNNDYYVPVINDDLDETAQYVEQVARTKNVDSGKQATGIELTRQLMSQTEEFLKQ